MIIYPARILLILTILNSYEFVRDAISHSGDVAGRAVTCAASDVLQAREGLCYAKSHLLAALLRSNGIPAGFCYQALRSSDGSESSTTGVSMVAMNALIWTIVKRVITRGQMNILPRPRPCS